MLYKEDPHAGISQIAMTMADIDGLKELEVVDIENLDMTILAANYTFRLDFTGTNNNEQVAYVRREFEREEESDYSMMLRMNAEVDAHESVFLKYHIDERALKQREKRKKQAHQVQ